MDELTQSSNASFGRAAFGVVGGRRRHPPERRCRARPAGDGGSVDDFGGETVVGARAHPEVDEGREGAGDRAEPGDDVAARRAHHVDGLGELAGQLVGEDRRDADLRAVRAAAACFVEDAGELLRRVHCWGTPNDVGVADQPRRRFRCGCRGWRRRSPCRPKTFGLLERILLDGDVQGQVGMGARPGCVESDALDRFDPEASGAGSASQLSAAAAPAGSGERGREARRAARSVALRRIIGSLPVGVGFGG